MGYENTDSDKLRTMVAMELAAPTHKLSGDICIVGQDPRIIKEAIDIMRKTLDQASDPNDHLHRDDVCEALKLRVENFSRRMSYIEHAWQEKHPVFGEQ